MSSSLAMSFSWWASRLWSSVRRLEQRPLVARAAELAPREGGVVGHLALRGGAQRRLHEILRLGDLADDAGATPVEELARLGGGMARGEALKVLE